VPDPIKHVVVLMLENHSFDRLLGCMKKINSKIEGVDEGAAATFAPALSDKARTDTLGLFDLSQLPLPPTLAPTTTNENQNAIVAFAHFLEAKMANEEELAAAGYRSLKSLDGPLAQLSVAKDRFLLFLHHGQKGRLDPN